MVSDSLTTAGFCLCSAILAVLLRQYSREQSLAAALAACVIVSAALLAMLSPLTSQLRELFSESGLSEGYISVVFKALAIAFITQLTSSLCRDCGESAIGSAAEMWGRGALVFLSLPLIRELMQRVGGLL